MSKLVDARGLSCPQPVIKTLNAIKTADESEIVVLVDTDTAKENVARAAKSKGWNEIDIKEEQDGYRITISKEG
ncbi:MAG: preprotein translocase subunit TatB [Clostridiales bacterium]|jgi:tRNA 2-thiouridine synthesizing protein A|nr:preprotein translocase subunit TatB [Clostridiales bacterium]